MSCVIVGAGPGLSASAARRFAGAGLPVALIARNPGRLAELCGELAAQGQVAEPLAADAGDAGQLRAALAKAAELLGPPAVLVYNVFSPAGTAAAETDPEQVAETLRPNALGALVATQAVLPAMRRRGAGTIIFTSGALALRPFPGNAALSVGKAALRALGLMLAAELRPQGIGVTTVNVCMEMLPGAPNTERVADAYLRLYQAGADGWAPELTLTEAGQDGVYPGSV